MITLKNSARYFIFTFVGTVLANCVVLLPLDIENVIFKLLIYYAAGGVFLCFYCLFFMPSDLIEAFEDNLNSDISLPPLGFIIFFWPFVTFCLTIFSFIDVVNKLLYTDCISIISLIKKFRNLINKTNKNQ